MGQLVLQAKNVVTEMSQVLVHTMYEFFDPSIPPGFQVFGEKLIYSTPRGGGENLARIFSVEVKGRSSTHQHVGLNCRFVYIFVGLTSSDSTVVQFTFNISDYM